MANVVNNEIDAILQGSSHDREASLALLRPVFISLLATINADNDQPMRRIAKYADLPQASRPLIDAFVEKRLLVRDERGGQVVVEVALESLLRQWDELAGWLREERQNLKTADEIERSARAWEAHDRNPAWLLRGTRLTHADTLATTEGFRSRLAKARDYLAASRSAEDETIQKEKARRQAQLSRLAADEQKIADRMVDGDFAEARDVLDQAVKYLADETDENLAARRVRLDQQLRRVSQLAGFSVAARQAMNFAGEERFEDALDQCEASLKSLGFGENAEWWQNLPTQDLQPAQVERLHWTAYRALLLLAGLRLVPGIVDVFGKPTPGPPRSGSGVVVQKLAGLLPRRVLLRTIAAGRIGPYKLPLPTHRDKPAARAEFDRCLDALAYVARIDEDAQARGTQTGPSRASCFLKGVVEVLHTFATGPDDAPIDYGQWLRLSMPDERPEPVNAADYFFIGLLNFFIAKRADTALLAKAISLLEQQFPDVDARAPLDRADRLLRSAVALEPQHYWPHWVLGRVLAQKGNYAAAELAFNAAIAVDQGYSRGYEQRALVLGSYWEATREPTLRTRAEDDSETARALADGDPSIFWPRGELFERLGESHHALDAYSRWLELEHNLLGTIARGAGIPMLDALASQLGRESDHGVRADAHALLAWVRLTRGEFEPALDAAEASLAISPTHPHALAAKGVVLCDREDLQQGLEFLERACEKDSFNYRAALHRAQASEQLGLEEEAQTAWKRLEEMSAQARDQRREKCPDWILKQSNRRTGAGLR
jgi:hypothetical protein